MKFSLSLKYNAVPEWQEKYINYTGLKKTIYALQAEQLGQSTSDNGVSTAKAGSSTDDAESSNDGHKLSGFMKVFKKKSAVDETTYEMDDLESQTNTSTSASGSHDPKQIFLSKLQDELAKIEEFFKLKEAEVLIGYNSLMSEAEVNKIYVASNDFMDDSRSILSRKSSITQEVLHTANSFNLPVEVTKKGEIVYHEHTPVPDVEDEDDDDDHSFSQHSALLSDADFDMETQISIKKRSTQLFIELSQLKAFIELNRLGFSKITKKFDKTMGTNLRDTLFNTNVFYEHSYTFSARTDMALEDRLKTIVAVYASATGRPRALDTCRAELTSHVKEHIVWERTTVWKEMVALQNRAENRADIKGITTNAGSEHELFDLEYYTWKLPFSIKNKHMKIENFKLPKFFNTARTYKLIFIIIVTIILLAVPTFNDEAEHRCMALLACVALLWATEAIPLFATSLLCPLLCVLFRVIKDSDGHVESASKASAYVLSMMWSSTIMVLLGGFALAAALSKYNIARIAASYILALPGDRPRYILLAIMSVALFLSMWISNVATPVLCYSLLSTILRQLPHDAPLAQALILGVALACNIAGMASPISSPQNVVAMDYLTPYGIGWGQWLGTAVPVSIIALVLVWLMLCLTFKLNTHKVAKVRPIREKFTLKQWFIMFVFIMTIILWCVLTKIQSAFGDAGEIAVIPLVLFFGTGLLTTSDMNNFPWSIVVLAMGSLALGKAVSSSGLLSTIAGALQRKIMDYDVWVILIIFGLLILVIGTFVSHTVSAIIIIPLVQEIGDSLADKKASPVLIFGTALLASCGMGLASSGFPNVTAISMTDQVGRRYLNVGTFITRGVPASLLAYIVVITVGYGIMHGLLK